MAAADLFPHVKARLKTVPFKVAQLPPGRTVDELRQQMLSVIFGWERGIEFLIRDQSKCLVETIYHLFLIEPTILKRNANIR